MRAGSGTGAYFLDDTADAILPYVDSNADGVPDQLGPVFASVGAFPFLSEVVSISSPVAGVVECAAGELVGHF